MKPTHEQAPGEVTPGALPTPVQDLLAAVSEALDLPLPSIDDADERAHYALLQQRASYVRIQLATLTDYPDVDMSGDADQIRAQIADMPVTYKVFEHEADGGQR
ncbi:hypothetical protein [Streptomyces sp. UG1]|uniref:hypothetical protein n=1 Tax=Streptomyces sp. UG1 TaxID=3417652 RepID=UPI003CFA8EEA